VPLLAVGVGLVGCGTDTAAPPTTQPATSPPATGPVPATGATTTPSAPGPAPSIAWEVVATFPHDPTAFTQGLLLTPDGRLFESTGLYGSSDVREVDLADGTVLQEADLAPELFGEGLALAGDRLVQLTWREGTALLWDPDGLEPLGSFAYEGEGWGLCPDGDRLVMSDGSARLTFRDPATFAVTGGVDVTLDGTPVDDLNELECVDGAVWANVWLTDRIVRIDLASGRVTGVLDLTGLLDRSAAPGADVLNGIAFRPDTGTFLVTGKLWPTVFELRLIDTDTRADTGTPG